MNKQQIKKSKIFSPGLIGGSVVHFLASEKGLFFLKHEGQEGYLKDDSGKYVKMAIDEVIEARLLYLNAFGEEEKEQVIQSELKSLQADLVLKATEIINNISKYEDFLNGKYHGVLALIIEAVTPDFKEADKQQAISFFNKNPNALEIKSMLIKFIELKDYEGLYQSIGFKFGEPLVSFNTKEGSDPTALMNVFGAANINNTIDELKEKGLLYLQAKIKVEKMYQPEN